MSYLPQLVSERQPTGHWDRCLESSFAMLTDKMSIGTQVLSAVRLEAHIPGAANGSTTAENIAAIASAYPAFPVSEIHAFRGSDVIEILLQGGKGFALIGDYGKLPAHFVRWDPLFAMQKPAGHATYVQIDGPNGERKWSLRDGKFVWWMDPLAVDGYPGEWMEIGTLYEFLTESTSAYAAEGSAIDSSSGPAIPLMYDFDLRPGTPSTVTVTGENHDYLRLSDGKLVPIDAGTVKTPAYPITLKPPIPGGSGDRASAWLVGTNGAALLAVDVTATPITDCAAAIAADRLKARVVYE